MMKMLRISAVLVFVLAVVGVVSSPLWAQSVNTNVPAEHPSVYRGVRPTGMGNAFLAMPGQDENAPFYNPAAINDYEKKLHFRILSPAFDFSPGIIGLVKDVLSFADDVDAALGDAAKIAVFRTFVNQHSGQFESVAIKLPVVQVQHRWFAVSILADSRSTISFRNRAFTNVEIFSRSDMGAVIGTAYNFKDLLGIDQNLQAGLNLKVLHRLSIDETITTDDIINQADFNAIIPRRRATGVGFDLGIKADFPTFGNGIMEKIAPTVGLTYQDVGNTRFAGVVPNTEQSLSLGFALHPKFGEDGQWQVNFANDFRELNQSTSFIKKWNIGTELQFPKFWGFFSPAVRIGGNQGYFAAGTTLDFKYAKLEFSTYGEEAGLVSQQKQLRRLAVNLSFGF